MLDHQQRTLGRLNLEQQARSLLLDTAVPDSTERAVDWVEAWIDGGLQSQCGH